MQGVLGAARVGYIDDKIVINPSIQDLQNSSLDLVVAGTDEGVLMVESEAKELPEATMLEAVNAGHAFYQDFISNVKKFTSKVEIKNFNVPELPEFYGTLKNDISSKISEDIRSAYGLTDKQERSQKLDSVRTSVLEGIDDEQKLAAITIVKNIEKDVVRGDIMEK